MTRGHREVAEVAQALEGRVTALSEAIAAQIVGNVDGLPANGGGQLRGTLEELSCAALRTELRHMKDGRQPATCPSELAESVRLATAARIPEVALLQTQRIAHAVVWDAYVEEVERAGMDPGPRRSALDAGSRFFFEHADCLARFVHERYQVESTRGHDGLESRRLRLVIDVIEGRTRELAALGYDVTLDHLGAIVWGEDLEHSVRDLTRVLGGRLLSVRPAPGAIWAWLSPEEPLGSGAARKLARFGGEQGKLALGEPGRGLDGFRRTHRQAQQAYRVALRRPQPVTSYREVALEALALNDECTAREFLALELGVLGDGDRAAILRETLRAYFRCAQNAAATGAALGVHEQTVAHRLREVEDRIGRPVNARRAELETALRIEDLLTPDREQS